MDFIEIKEHEIKEQVDTTIKSSKYYCYILENSNEQYSEQTYNGSTNNLKRRLRQHNGEICGGAKATSGKGPWKYMVILEGFQDHKEALCCEWRIKHPTGARQRPKKYCGRKGRVSSLNLVLNLDNWTSKSIGLNTGKEYILYISNEYDGLIDDKNIKPNIKIKSIDDLKII
jgi:predicted GIY-YIG superfamily endonuclease